MDHLSHCKSTWDCNREKMTRTTSGLKNWLTFGWFSSGLIFCFLVDAGVFTGLPFLLFEVPTFGICGTTGLDGAAAATAFPPLQLKETLSWNGIGLTEFGSNGSEKFREILSTL